MRHLLSGLLITTAIAISAPQAIAEDFRMLTGWDTSYAPVTAVLDPFMQRLQEDSDGNVNITRSGPETIPPFEQLDPVSRGLFDMLFTNGAYHYNETSIGMTLDAVSADPTQLRESGIWGYVDEQYQTLGLKLVAVLYDMNGYNIILKEPLGDNALEGRRVRGTPIYHPLIEKLGGAPVVLPASEIYPSLERGVVEGAAWPTVGAVGFRWFEVADYMMRPSFGQVGHVVLMNLDRWNALDDETKELIERVAGEFEMEAIDIFNDVVAKEEETLASEGMQVTELEGEFLPLIGETWYEGAMTLAAEQNAEAIAEVRRLAEEAGLTGAEGE
jgi:TRAP-type transport system periplasmic protein